MKEWGKPMREWVEVMCFVVFMSIAATVRQGKIFRNGLAAEIQRNDVVERKSIG